MAIPLRKLKSPDSDTRHDRDSIDSEASAILSYALGKHEDLDDQSETDIDSPRRSSFALEDEDTEAFLKENDPLEGDYEPWTTRLKSRRFRIFVCVALTVGSLGWIIALIGFLSKGYFLPHQAPSSPVAASRRVTFERVVSGDFFARYKSLEWTSSLVGDDGVFLTREHSQIIREHVNGTKEVIADESDIFQPDSHLRLHFENYWISGNEQYILLATHRQKNWRHSYFANYYIYHISTKTTTPLIPDSPNAMIDYAVWSPTAAKVAYVYNHDVYVRDIPHGINLRVTYDGGPEVFNGVADWVFEEEVFGSRGCIWWSPSSNHIAYIHINESQVPVYSIPYYIPDSPRNDPLPYPTFKDIKYPKPGYPNPVADLYVYPLGGETWKVTYPEPVDKRDLLDDLLGDWEDELFERQEGEGHETDGWGDKKLITNVEWMGDYAVLVSETNRVSDHFRGVLVDVQAQTGQVVRDEKVQEGWFEISHYMKYIPADPLRGRLYDGYIDVVDHDGYNHLGYFSPLNSSTPQYITGGDWEVTDGISGFDRNSNTVYFLSTMKSPVERHLYSISLFGKDLTPLTDVTEDGYYGVSFSPQSQYYVLSYNGPQIPYQKVKSTTDPTFELVLEQNEMLTELLSRVDLPQRRFGTVDVNGTSLNYLEIVPPNFDDSGRTRYPVLFQCYGGPVSQMTEKKYSVDWHSWLASEPRLEYVIVVVDGRGTGFMGRQFRAGVRGHLGIQEAYDQAATAAIWKQKDYVNSEKVALWGWSYGGFLTLKTLESQPGAFKYGMAVAPVTDWRYYDSIYTERYMLTPHANSGGYQRSAIINTTALGEAKRFFIAHGTGDDNVHIQNSLALMDRLTDSGVRNWDSQVFTDDDHSIVFHGGNQAIYWRLAEWLERWFGRKEPGGRIWVVDGELLGYKEGIDSD